MFWFFGHEACGIFAPQPGIEPALIALEGKVLTTGPSGKCLFYILSNEMNILVECISQCFHAKPGQSLEVSTPVGLVLVVVVLTSPLLNDSLKMVKW